MMNPKAFVFAFALMAATTPAHAESAEETCTNFGVLAQNLMIARQQGVSMSVVMSKVKTGIPEADEVIRLLIIGAYNVPRFNTPKYVNKMVEDYRNQAELECFTVFGGKV